MTTPIRILLVDDHSQIHLGISAVVEIFDDLEIVGHASNGEEAIRKLANREVVPDLIFVDMNMPLMNGTQFLKERNRLDGVSTIPVIILTTSSSQKSIEETLSLGARDYITKPDRFSGWGNVIREKINAYRKASDQ